uniref:Uncharacterized protein n=1 Tax=Equus asinus TaxID=9793 RepID=A0A9L0K357_EQUAS
SWDQLIPVSLRGLSRAKQETNEREDPSGFVASCPALWPLAHVPGASPTAPASCSACGPSTHGGPSALSLPALLSSLPSGSLCPPGPQTGLWADPSQGLILGGLSL